MTPVEKIYNEESTNTGIMQSGAKIDEVLFQSWKDSLTLAGPRENDSLVNGDRIQVYRESYALLTQVFEAVVNIQKDYKSIPGEDIRRGCLELVRCVLHANDAKKDAVRASFIKKALVCDEDIKLLLRILCDLKQISPGAYMMLSGMVVSISGQLKAWLSYTEKHSNQKVTGTLHTQGQGSE